MTKILKYYVPYNEINENMFIMQIAESELRDGDIINGALINSNDYMVKDVVVKIGEVFRAMKIGYIELIETDKEIKHDRFVLIHNRNELNTYRVI